MWCTSCLVMKKRWKIVFESFPQFEIIDYDFDFDEKKVRDFEVGNILPVLILFDHEGSEIKRIIGEKSVKEMMKLLGETAL